VAAALGDEARKLAHHLVARACHGLIHDVDDTRLVAKHDELDGDVIFRLAAQRQVCVPKTSSVLIA
jgi:hypothetical protein